jgi:hypothetical protein
MPIAAAAAGEIPNLVPSGFLPLPDHPLDGTAIPLGAGQAARSRHRVTTRRSYYTNVASPGEGDMLRVSLSAKRDHPEGHLDLFQEDTTADEHAAVISEGGPSGYQLT